MAFCFLERRYRLRISYLPEGTQAIFPRKNINNMIIYWASLRMSLLYRDDSPMQFAPSAISRRVPSRLGVRRGCLALLAPLSAEALSPSAVETVTGEAGPQTDAGAIGGAPHGGVKWHGPRAPDTASLAAAGLSGQPDLRRHRQRLFSRQARLRGPRSSCRRERYLLRAGGPVRRER